MGGNERRRELVKMIENNSQPVSGSKLASQLNVSRQVIVQDIALLRAENIEIISTTKGYMIMKGAKRCQRKFYVQHTDEQTKDELLTIIDQGGKVCDVIIDHPIYGEIKVDLPLQTRQDVYDFIKKVKNKETIPLSKLTNQRHIHTVEAESEEILQNIEMELNRKEYLIRE